MKGRFVYILGRVLLPPFLSPSRFSRHFAPQECAVYSASTIIFQDFNYPLWTRKGTSHQAMIWTDGKHKMNEKFNDYSLQYHNNDKFSANIGYELWAWWGYLACWCGRTTDVFLFLRLLLLSAVDILQPRHPSSTPQQKSNLRPLRIHRTKTRKWFIRQRDPSAVML